LEEAFSYIDKNKDGKLPAEEFKTMMINQGDKLTPEECDILYKELGIDANGTIEFANFITLLQKCKAKI